MPELSSLERSVLEAIAEQHPNLAAAFRSQLGSVVVTERRNSGAGMFADLAVTDPAALPLHAKGPIGDVRSTVGDKLMAFMVFLDNGLLSCLEGYMLDDGNTKHIDFVSAPFTPIEMLYPPS